MKELFFRCSAFAVLAVFYGCYFLKMASQRRRGIRSDRLGKGKTGTAMRIENWIRIVTLLVPIAEILSILFLPALSPLPLRTAGLLLGIAGDAVFVLSVRTMKDSWRAGVSETEHTELVTRGIYRFSRNPAFLGFDLVYLGILCMYPNAILFLLSALASILFHLQITKNEEPFLLNAFGEAYAEYSRHTNRYLGRK